MSMWIGINRAHNSVLAFANLPPTSAESPPTYRGERGTQLVGANRRHQPRSAALSARARQLTPQALGKRHAAKLETAMRGKTTHDVRPIRAALCPAPALGRRACRAGGPRLRRRLRPGVHRRRLARSPRTQLAGRPGTRLQPLPQRRRQLVRARPLRQQNRLRPDPAPDHARRRPPQPALRHHGQVRLPRPRPDHPGDRPRPLRQRPRLGPDRRRQRSAGVRRRRHASATRSRSTTPAPALSALSRPRRSLGRSERLICRCSGSAISTRGAAVCRGLRTEHSPRSHAAGSPAGAGAGGRLPWRSSIAPRRRHQRRHGRRRPPWCSAQTSTAPDPSCPELPCQAVGSVTGFQVSNGQTQLALPRPPRRHDQGLDPDPGPADQQAALLLQRLLRHAAGGAPGDPAPRPRHQPAPLQPAQPGRGQGPLAPTSARRSNSAPR